MNYRSDCHQTFGNRLQAGIDESLKYLQDKNPSYFSQRMPGNQIWRLFNEFRDSTVYVDIETTGLDRFSREDHYYRTL